MVVIVLLQYPRSWSMILQDLGKNKVIYQLPRSFEIFPRFSRITIVMHVMILIKLFIVMLTVVIMIT